MSDIAIYVVPSPYADAWLAALKDRIAKAADGAGDDPRGGAVSVTDDFETFSAIEAPQRIVIWGGVAAYWQWQAPLPADPLLDAEVLTARRLARLADLLVTGGDVIDASAIEITIPGLGAVHRLVGRDVAPRGLIPTPDTLAIYDAMPPTPGPGAVWPLGLFFDLSGPVGAKAEAGIDLTGRARFILFGPYIDLPRGHWGVTFRFRFEGQSGVKPHISLDWGTQSRFVSQEFTLGASGWYEIKLERTWRSVEPAEFRLQLLRANFHGVLLDASVMVERLVDTPDAYLGQETPPG